MGHGNNFFYPIPNFDIFSHSQWLLKIPFSQGKNRLAPFPILSYSGPYNAMSVKVLLWLAEVYCNEHLEN